MAQLSGRMYLKYTLLIAGVVNAVFGSLLIASGFMVKNKLHKVEIIDGYIDRKNPVDASQYWAGIPIILIGLFAIAVAHMPKHLTANILAKIFLLISLILALAVIVAEAGDRNIVYTAELSVCKLDHKSKEKYCDLIKSARHWYGALVFSAVIIFGSSLMGILSLFPTVMSLLANDSDGNLNTFSMDHVGA